MSEPSLSSAELTPRQAIAAIALVGLAYLPLAQQLAPRVGLYVAVLVLWRLACLRWPLALPGRWLLLPLTLAGMANVFAAYHTLVGQEGGTALLATMLALKLLEMRRPRDARAIVVLFGFLLVSQFLFDQSAWLALYLLALLVADLALMIDLSAQGRTSLRGAAALAMRLTLQAVPLTLVLFVLFPRLAAPLWDLGPTSERGRSGISDSMEPGAISELVLSREPAFRVRFEGSPPPASKLYWRGPVAWTTDGRRWTGNPSPATSPAPPPLASAGDRIAYQVLLEPTRRRTLFALDMPVQLPADARVSRAYEVSVAKDIDAARRYRAVSALTYNTGALSPAEARAGLQLPPNVTPRMRALVAGWKAQAATPREVVQAALRFFHREPFYYTLVPPRLGSNPADQFLFETRRGFCEHYASSFALLMRIGGIPARIVLGYLGGERNPIGDYLIVRQSDAHAWVEVWLAGEGWVRVDPTAAVAPERVERSDILADMAAGAPARFRIGDPGTVVSWVHHLRLLADALDAGWRTWVLDYSSSRQQRLLEAVGLGFLREYGLALAMILASAVVLAIMAGAMGRRRAPRDPLVRIYASFCQVLAARRLARRPNEGPIGFSARAGERRPDLRRPIQSFLTLYLPLRYGRTARTPEVLQELRRRLAQVAAAPRKAPARPVNSRR
jgi:transglutaminase-like putative cysteine protease